MPGFPEGVVQYWGTCKLCKGKTFLGVTSNTCTKCKLGKYEPKEVVQRSGPEEQQATETPARAKATPEAKEGPKSKPKGKEVSKARISPKATPEVKEGPEPGWQWDETRKMWVMRNEKGRVMQSVKEK